MKKTDLITIVLIVIGTALIIGGVMLNQYEILSEDLRSIFVGSGFIFWLLSLISVKD